MAVTKYLIQNGNPVNNYSFSVTTSTTGPREGVNLSFTQRGFDTNSVSSNYRRLRENVTGYANRQGSYYLSSDTSFSGWSKLRCTMYSTHNATDGTGRYTRLYLYKSSAAYLDSGTKGTNYQYVQAGTSSATKDISLTSTLINNCNRVAITVATSYADVSGYVKDLWLERDNYTYTITYKANGGSGSDVTDTKTENVTLTLKTFAQSGFTAPSGYKVTFNANGGSTTKSSQTSTKSFSSWNTASGGGGTSYSGGGSYTANAAATLYAQWSNGSVTLPTTSQCTRAGYQLLGFSTSNTATTQDSGLTPGASYTPSGNVTLYAVWKAYKLTIKFNVNGGTITTGTGTTRYRATSAGVVQVSSDSGSTWADLSQSITSADSYANLWNVGTYGATKTGYYITGTSAYRTAASSGTEINQDTASASDTNAATIARMNGGALTADTTITLYVYWRSYTLTIKFNTNGGSITTGTGTTRYRSNSGTVQVSSDSGSTWADLTNTLTNDDSYINLWNVGTYGATKTGYYITGTRAYRTGASSGNYINQDTSSTSDTNAATMANFTGSSVLTANTTITIYVHWISYELTINYHANGGTVTTGTGTKRHRLDENTGLIQTSFDSGATWNNAYNSMTNDDAYKDLADVSSLDVSKVNYMTVSDAAYSTASSGGTLINEATTSTSDINAATMQRLTGNSILTADTTIVLYINWQISQLVFSKVYISGAWKDAIPYIYTNNSWKQAKPNLRVSSEWKE